MSSAHNDRACAHEYRAKKGGREKESAREREREIILNGNLGSTLATVLQSSQGVSRKPDESELLPYE